MSAVKHGAFAPLRTTFTGADATKLKKAGAIVDLLDPAGLGALAWAFEALVDPTGSTAGMLMPAFKTLLAVGGVPGFIKTIMGAVNICCADDDEKVKAWLAEGDAVATTLADGGGSSQVIWDWADSLGVKHPEKGNEGIDASDFFGFGITMKVVLMAVRFAKFPENRTPENYARAAALMGLL